MITNTCVLSYTEVLQKKAEELYNKHRNAATATVVLPKWRELPQQSRVEWMRFAKCYEEPRQNKLMP